MCKYKNIYKHETLIKNHQRKQNIQIEYWYAFGNTYFATFIMNFKFCFGNHTAMDHPSGSDFVLMDIDKMDLRKKRIKQL